jgi:hypothetical protein
VSEPLSEYDLALTAYGQKRRLWAERHLGFPKPPQLRPAVIWPGLDFPSYPCGLRKPALCKRVNSGLAPLSGGDLPRNSRNLSESSPVTSKRITRQSGAGKVAIAEIEPDLGLQLERLSQLRNKGILTDEEFETMSRRLGLL